MSLFWCGVQAVILAYKDIIFFGMAATQWSLLGFQGWWNTSVQVYSLLAPTSSSSAKCAVDQKSHKHANISPLLSSQSLYTANAQQQAPLTVPFIFSWYTVKLLRPLLIISWIWGSTIFSKETVSSLQYQWTSQYFYCILFLYTNIPHLLKCFRFTWTVQEIPLYNSNELWI